MRMSCNGCRGLGKICTEDCSIRPCLRWINSPDSQAYATVFLAKFYGLDGLMNLNGTTLMYYDFVQVPKGQVFVALVWRDPKANDFKVVKIVNAFKVAESVVADVYSLGTDSWKTSNNNDVIFTNSVSDSQWVFLNVQVFGESIAIFTKSSTLSGLNMWALKEGDTNKARWEKKINPPKIENYRWNVLCMRSNGEVLLGNWSRDGRLL
ncbi:hypothetical protein POM88_020049 [Heracleum sosnowskyi]|uniref:LOB domain-containing protein n=1 Tax=Heracleum sosnowskyi TaxID=360622 RepID=A0AAD8IAT7_9APIA|nr:hypothetical protein POM88_020049 [Heracleum sosnowskyi]